MTTIISGDTGIDKITDGTVVTADIVDDAVTLAKMAGGTDGNLITYDTSGDPAYVATGTSGQVLTSAGAGAVPTFQTAASSAGKNRIINGDMLIAQRGTTGTAGAAGDYLASDRWKAWDASDAVVTVSQETDAPAGFLKCLKFNVTTADSSITASQFGMVRQMIEGYNIIDLDFGSADAKTVTISFWVKSSLTGSHGAALTNGNEDRSYPFAYTISSANTWEKKTVSIAGDTSGTWDTDNTAGMILTFGMGTGSTYEGTADTWQAGNKFQPTSTVAPIGTVSNWNVTGVQLEANSIATDFEHLQYTTQLQLCQRYCFKLGGKHTDDLSVPAGGYGDANYMGFGKVHFPVQMRAAPSLTTLGSPIYWRGNATITGWTWNNTTSGSPTEDDCTIVGNKVSHGGTQDTKAILKFVAITDYFLLTSEL
jgi:hypothetical protein